MTTKSTKTVKTDTANVDNQAVENIKAQTPPQLPVNPDVETVTFETPFLRGEILMKSVNINKPKTGALRGLSLAKIMELDVDSVIKLTPRISTPPLAEHEVAELDPVDFMKINTAVIGFFASKAEKAEAQAMSK